MTRLKARMLAAASNDYSCHCWPLSITQRHHAVSGLHVVGKVGMPHRQRNTRPKSTVCG